MADFSFIAQLALALAVGGLIGMERESAFKSNIIGVRSFVLLTILGLATTLLAPNYPLIVPVGLAGAFAIGILYYWFKFRKYHFLGVTTALAIPFSFGLGVMIGNGQAAEAGVLAIAMTFILAERERIHAVVQKLTQRELIDILIFGILAFIVYPFLPTEPIPVLGQPFDVAAAFRVIILVQFINIWAHLAVKTYRGAAGVVSAFFGSLVSSVAYLYAILKSHGKHTFSQIRLHFTVGTAGALLRNILLIALVNNSLLNAAAAPLVTMVLVSAVLWVHFDRNAKPHKGSSFVPDLTIWTAVRFAVLFAAITLAVSFVTHYSHATLLVTSFLAGAISSASAVSSIAILTSTHAISTPDAVNAIVAAMIGELVAKIVLVSLLSKPNFGRVLLPALIIGAAGVIALLVV